MASPLFNGPMAQMFQTINTIQQLRQNPGSLGQFLFEHNKINQNQLNEINQLSSPEQIGMYLMNNNVLPQQEAMQLYQQGVPQVQQALQK